MNRRLYLRAGVLERHVLQNELGDQLLKVTRLTAFCDEAESSISIEPNDSELRMQIYPRDDGAGFIKDFAACLGHKI